MRPYTNVQFSHPIILSEINPSIGIGHFEKYLNTLCLFPQILHKHCFQFLLGITMVPRENKNNAYAKFGGQTKSIKVFSQVVYWAPHKNREKLLPGWDLNPRPMD